MIFGVLLASAPPPPNNIIFPEKYNVYFQKNISQNIGEFISEKVFPKKYFQISRIFISKKIFPETSKNYSPKRNEKYT